MSLGDKPYASASFTPPIANYPRATYADYLRRVLRQCYLHAQHHGRVLFCQNYVQSLKDLEDAVTNTKYSIYATALRGIARGRCTIPRETTHVLARVLYLVHERNPVDVNFRLLVDDGTSTDQAVRTITPDVVSQRIDSYEQPDGGNPFTGIAAAILYDELEVELRNVSQAIPGRCRIDVEAYTMKAGSLTDAREFRPLYILGVAEMRY